MATSDISNLVIGQTTIKVSVEYYNDEERQKLMGYPTASAIRDIVQNGIEIPVPEFLTYYLFHKKRPGKEGWRNYDSIGAKIEISRAELRDWVDFNGTSISTPTDIEYQVTTITERIGESIGLSVISKIHDLTDADWEHISERRGVGGVKTFDYEIAADNRLIVHLETKGSSAKDNRLKTDSIKNLKREITNKKIEIRNLQGKNAYPQPADIHYGTIIVMGEDKESPVKCFLVDPPADGDSLSASRIKLLSRLRFIRDWISFLSPRSQIASAMQTRVASLEVMEDPFAQSRIPLLKGNGERFDFSPSTIFGTSTFFANKSRIADGPAGGVCIRLDQNRLFFLGIREELLQVAASQNFDTLTQLRYEAASLEKTVDCVFSEGRFRNLGLFFDVTQVPTNEGYVLFRLKGIIHYSASGILFGVLPLTPG